ncbi:unnamed protein product, partial [Iphiclides podalirius]
MCTVVAGSEALESRATAATRGLCRADTSPDATSKDPGKNEHADGYAAWSKRDKSSPSPATLPPVRLISAHTQ